MIPAAEGNATHELETNYEPAEIEDETRKSQKPEDIKKCLRAGVIPEMYEDILSGIEVIEKQVTEEPVEFPKSPYLSVEDAKARAAEGYFVRDPEQNVVYCPGGATMRLKSIRKNGNLRFCNKSACGKCPHRGICFTGKQSAKEVEFTKDSLEIPNRVWLKAKGKTPESKPRKPRKHKTVEKVKFTFSPDREKMKQRKCLSEHPFGTAKRSLNAECYLTRGKRMVRGETALTFLAYNIRRALNLLGFGELMKAMASS